MPQIASPQASASSHAPAPPRRSAQQAEPASSSPFVSLLDQTDPPAAAPAQQQAQTQPQQGPDQPAAQAPKPEEKAAGTAPDAQGAAAPTTTNADSGQTAVVPLVAAAADAANSVTNGGKPVTDTSATPSKPDGSTEKDDKKGDQTVDAATDAAANAQVLAAAQPAANNPPAGPAAAAIIVQTAQQTAVPPASTAVAATVVAKGGQPAVLPQPLSGTGNAGAAKGTPVKADAGKSSDASADPKAATTDATPDRPDILKASAAPSKADAPKSDGAPVVTTDSVQQGVPQPDPTAQAVAPANGSASTLPPTAVADKIVPAAGKPADAPRHDIDATSALNAGSNGLTTTGGDTAAAQAASASAAATAGGSAATTGSATMTGASAAPSTLVPIAVPLSGLAVEIAGKALANKNRFEIRLDPPELGRIEVKLSVDKQGQITSHVIADRSDTLDLLRRDASGLERSLQDAGLKMTGNGLQFSLRDQSSSGQQNTGGDPRASQIIVQDNVSVETPRGYRAYSNRLGGLDIRV